MEKQKSSNSQSDLEKKMELEESTYLTSGSTTKPQLSRCWAVCGTCGYFGDARGRQCSFLLCLHPTTPGLGLHHPCLCPPSPHLLFLCPLSSLLRTLVGARLRPDNLGQSHLKTCTYICKNLFPGTPLVSSGYDFTLQCRWWGFNLWLGS